MRILVISQYWYPENGVPQRRWSWICDLLRDAGHEVLVVTPKPNYRVDSGGKCGLTEIFPKMNSETGPSGETIIRTGSIRLGGSLVARAIAQAIMAVQSLFCMVVHAKEIKKADAVVGTIPAIPSAFLARFVALVLGVPYAIDLRDAWPDLMKNSASWNDSLGKHRSKTAVTNGVKRVLTRVVAPALDRVLRGARCIVVTSADLKRQLEASFVDSESDGMSAPTVYTIRNVFPHYSKRNASEQRAESDTLKVLYAGTLGRAQNLANAIRAAKIARTQGVDVQLRFVGTGAAKEYLVDLAKSLDVEVQFYSFNPPQSLDDHYSWADTALVHLTDWEPLGRAVPSKTFELMAVGIHITGVAEGETKRLIEMLRAGDTAAPEDPHALANLWGNLHRNPGKLRVGPEGRNWVVRQREEIVPGRIVEIVRTLEAGNEN